MKKKAVKKMLGIGLSIAMLGTVLTGCGNSEATADPESTPEEAVSESPKETEGAEDYQAIIAEKDPAEWEGEISIWTWNVDGVQLFIDSFNEVYPNVKVDPVAVTYDDYVSKVQMSIASGSDLPDILQAEMGFREQLFQLDTLEYLEEAPYNYDRNSALSYVPDITSYEGKIVALEDSINATAMAYKKELAKEYLGTDDPAELSVMFKTWDDYIEAGKKVQEASNGQVFILSNWADVTDYMNNAGTQPYTENNKVTDFCLNERAQLRYDTLVKMLENKTIDATIPGTFTTAWDASFSENNHIFYSMPTWSIVDGIQRNDPEGKERWNIIPAVDGSFNNGGTAWGISKTSKNKDLAWLFLNYTFNTMEGMEKCIGSRNYYVPNKELVETHDFSQDASEYWGDANIYQTYMKELAPLIEVRKPEYYLSKIYNSYLAVDNEIINGTEMSFEEYQELLIERIKAECPELEW